MQLELFMLDLEKKISSLICFQLKPSGSFNKPRPRHPKAKMVRHVSDLTWRMANLNSNLDRNKSESSTCVAAADIEVALASADGVLHEIGSKSSLTVPISSATGLLTSEETTTSTTIENQTKQVQFCVSLI